MLVRKTGPSPLRRRGATLVESAIVYPVLFFLLLMIILGAMVVFRYQQVAHMAREGSRYASVHGNQYAKENGTTAADEQEIYDKAVVPQAGGIDPKKLRCDVAWDANKNQYSSKTVDDKVVYQANTVSVTVTCDVDTIIFGSFTVSSTSVSTMHY